MHSLNSRRVLACITAFTHLLIVISLAYPRLGWTQEIDADPPRIDLQPLSEGLKGDSQVFSAAVTDEVGVTAVTLYYRFVEDGPFDSLSMDPVGSTAKYVATIETENIDPSPDFIQYYIVAKDEAGNQNFRGFAFDPEQRQLVQPTSTAAASVNEPAQATGMSTTRKVVYGVIGLMVVGALASAAGGGGSDPAPAVDITVVVDPLL